MPELLLREDWHKGPRLDGQQIVFPHEPRHRFVVHQQAPPAQLRRDPPIPVPAPMRQGDLLNLGPHQHRFLHGLGLLQRSVKPCPAHLGQLAHPLDPQPALPRHHRPDRA